MNSTPKHSVLVVSPDPSVPGGVTTFIQCMKRHIRGSKVDSFAVGSSGKESAVAAITRLVTGPLCLAQRVSKKKYDVVHINPSFDVKSLIRDSLLLFALRVTGYRHTLFYIHGWDSAVQRGIAGNFLLRRIVAWILNGAGMITVLGEKFRQGLIEIGVDPVRVIVTRTMFDGELLKKTDHQENTPQRPFVLFMSRFDRQKGGRELMHAFTTILPDYPKLDLVMAGDGEDMDFLRALAQSLTITNRVIFTGYVSGARKAQLLKDCQIFALPTYYRSEGMPVVLLEAMGAGKPLLVGDAGAIGSIVSEPENGIVLDRVTAENIATGLRRLLSNRDLSSTAAKNNATLAWEKYEAHVVTAEIENYYRRVAQC